jgi:hypothetical protein
MRLPSKTLALFAQDGWRKEPTCPTLRDTVLPVGKSTLKHIALLLFVIFMTNIGVWVFSAARLTHELEHNGIEQVANAHEHVNIALSDATNDDDDGMPDLAEHQTLHAADHLQFFADTSAHVVLTSGIATLALRHFTERTLPFPALDPLFRPPRRQTA